MNAISRYYSHDNANVHRGVHYLSQEATDKFENTRKSVRTFINAKNSCEIIFTKGLVLNNKDGKNTKRIDNILRFGKSL